MYEQGRQRNHKISIDKKTAEWGLKKFDPNANKETKNPKNPFSRPQSNTRAFETKRNGKFEKTRDNERVRFNPIARDAKPESATPWVKFKDEINYKQREEQQATKQANMDTKEGKQILQQREMNYRKMMMEQKRQEPTSWEDFGVGNNDNSGSGKLKKTKKNAAVLEETQCVSSEDKPQTKKKNKNKKQQKSNVEVTNDGGNNANAGSLKKKKKEKYLNELKETPAGRKSDQCNDSLQKGKKKNKTEDVFNSPHEVGENPNTLINLLPNGTAENFDIANMNFKQKDNMRKLITKSMTIGRSSLKQNVKHMKRGMEKKKILQIERLQNKCS